MRLLLISLAGLVLLGAAPAKYIVGQVWEYHTRPGDEASLLKIQMIDHDPAFAARGPIYHISIIGFHLPTDRLTPVIPHAPVTGAVLDASVTRLHAGTVEFPSADAGIAGWRDAKGGVFTISVAEIVGLLDDSAKDMVARMDAAQ